MVSEAFGCHGFTLVCDFHHKFRKSKKKAPKLPRILISRFVEFFVVLIQRFDVLGVDLHCLKFSSPNSSYFARNHRFSTPISAQIEELRDQDFLEKVRAGKSRTADRLKPAHSPAKAIPASFARAHHHELALSRSTPPRQRAGRPIAQPLLALSATAASSSSLASAQHQLGRRPPRASATPPRPGHHRIASAHPDPAGQRLLTPRSRTSQPHQRPQPGNLHQQLARTVGHRTALAQLITTPPPAASTRPPLPSPHQLASINTS
jgi:hypothetical protein